MSGWPQAGGAPRRVLIVDDNEDAADSLAMLLAAQGDTVRTAYDGEQALDADADFLPDVVLLDIGLPKLSGYDVARAIRARRGVGVLIVAITGWGQDDDRRRAHEAGFDHHFTKPVDVESLIDLVERERPRPPVDA